jgi:hypothetical protein
VKKILKISFLTLSTIILLVVLFSFWKYYSWEKEFEENMNKNNLVTAPYDRSEETAKKIVLFTLSDKDTEYLELTSYELGGLLLQVASSYPVEHIYIYPSLGVWKVYANVKYKNIPVWLSVDLNKDDMQTAQLYVTNVYFGPYEIGNIFNITDMINTGIADALLTVNENGFSGRYLENIELLEDKVVVKGSKY